MWPLVGLFVVAAIVSSKNKEKKKTAPPKPPNAKPPGSLCKLDEHMPAAEQQATVQLLDSPYSTPQALEGAAQLAGLHGYPLAAACLRSEAQRRAGEANVSAPSGLSLEQPETWVSAMSAAQPQQPQQGPTYADQAQQQQIHHVEA